jgi:hypothetical protein
LTTKEKKWWVQLIMQSMALIKKWWGIGDVKIQCFTSFRVPSLGLHLQELLAFKFNFTTMPFCLILFLFFSCARNVSYHDQEDNEFTSIAKSCIYSNNFYIFQSMNVVKQYGIYTCFALVINFLNEVKYSCILLLGCLKWMKQRSFAWPLAIQFQSLNFIYLYFIKWLHL